MANTISFKPQLGSYRWPLFALLFVSFFSAILGDSTAEALLLAHIGSAVVPSLFLVNALLLFLVSMFIMSIIDRVDRATLFTGFILVHAVILMIIRLAVALGAEFVYAPLFSYAYVTKIMLFSLFWTLANDLVDSRRARIEFPFIAAGGTLGAITVSFAIPYLLRVIRAENLLIIWSATGLATGALFIPIRQSFRNYFRPMADRGMHFGSRLKALTRDLALVRTEPLLRSMGLFYFLLFFLIFNQHFAFYAQLKAHFGAAENQARELAVFLGFFNGISMFSTLLLQMTVAGSVIRTAGSTRALFILPSVLLVVFGVLTWVGLHNAVSGAAVAAPLMFWAVVAGVGVRIAFFDSFFSPNFQAFFSSMPQEVRGRGKLSIEGVIKPLAMVVAGVWLGTITPRIAFHTHMLILLGVSALMVAHTARFRGTYAESLSRYLQSFRSRNTEWLRCFSSAPREGLFLDTFKDILGREEPEIKECMIELLAPVHSPRAGEILCEHLPGSDARTRAAIVSALSGTRDAAFEKLLSEQLQRETDARVIATILQALMHFDDEQSERILWGYLTHNNNRIRANAAVSLWNRSGPDRRDALTSTLREMVESADPSTCAAGLFALGEIGHPDCIPLLGAMLGGRGDYIMTNRMVWHQYVRTLARSADLRALDILLALADRVTATRRNDLSTALGLMISRGVDCEGLLFRLAEVSFVERAVILKAVHNRHRVLSKELRRTLQGVAMREIEDTYRDWLAVHTLSEPGDAAREVLRYALIEECVAQRVRNLLYFAAILDKTGKIRTIIHRLQHENRYVRARAFEVLDNVGALRVNRAILKLLESSDPAVHAREAAAVFALVFTAPENVVQTYAASPSAWVRQCIGYVRDRGAVALGVAV